MVLPPAFAGEFLGCVARDDLVEDRLLVSLFAQEPAQALDMLTDAASAGQDDADVRGWHINTLVEHLTGGHDGILSGMKALEDELAFLGFGLVGDGWHQEAAGD